MPLWNAENLNMST